jgi:hypothetical protein
MKSVAVARQERLAVSAGVAQVPVGANPSVRAESPVLRGVR